MAVAVAVSVCLFLCWFVGLFVCFVCLFLVFLRLCVCLLCMFVCVYDCEFVCVFLPLDPLALACIENSHRELAQGSSPKEVSPKSLLGETLRAELAPNLLRELAWRGLRRELVRIEEACSEKLAQGTCSTWPEEPESRDTPSHL